MRFIFAMLATFALICADFSMWYSPVYALEQYEMTTVMKTATFRFNNENWFTAPHPKIAQFTILDNGDSYGLTETGIEFTQYTAPNDLGIRVQRFEIQDHYHYVINGEIAYTPMELSVRLAQAYAQQTQLSV